MVLCRYDIDKENGVRDLPQLSAEDSSAGQADSGEFCANTSAFTRVREFGEHT